MALYRNPAFSVSHLIVELDEILTVKLCNQNVILFGDLNIFLKSTGTTKKDQEKICFLLGIEYSTTFSGTK